MPGVDAHTHLFAPSQVASRAAIAGEDSTFAEMYGNPRAQMATVDELLVALDEADIDRAVAAGFAFSRASDLATQNEYLRRAAAESGGRIVPLATVNPALPGWERTATTSIDHGARGFGELRPHSQGWSPLGVASHRLCELAATSDSVLLWHVSEPVGHTYAGKRGGIAPAELCELASAHPSTIMIAAHLGGGLAFYLQMPEVRAALSRTYFDTAASSLLYDDASIARLIDLAGPDRVLFGSDYPLLSPRRQIQRIIALLPGDTARAVCGGNADTLFSDRHDS